MGKKLENLVMNIDVSNDSFGKKLVKIVCMGAVLGALGGAVKEEMQQPTDSPGTCVAAGTLLGLLSSFIFATGGLLTVDCLQERIKENNK